MVFSIYSASSLAGVMIRIRWLGIGKPFAVMQASKAHHVRGLTTINVPLLNRGTSNDKSYHVELEFFKNVDTDAKESKWAVGKRNIHFFIMKKDKEDEFWPRLLKCKNLEKTNVKTDWDKYVDEDEEDEDSGFDMSALSGAGGFDINQMMAQQAAMGAGDASAEPDSDDDDDDLPDLESPN